MFVNIKKATSFEHVKSKAISIEHVESIIPTPSTATIRHDVDVGRHAGEEIPTDPIPKPQLGASFELDEAVVEVLPVPGSRVLTAKTYGMSLWGHTGKITVDLPGGGQETYFIKTVALGDSGRMMIEGEFESLKAINGVSSDFAPLPYAWGKYRESETYFLLAQFRGVGDQPPDPAKFTARLAEMHKKSVSPTGKFGFHITTCHAKLPQVTDCWEESWEVLYGKQLSHMINLDQEKHGSWPEFQLVCRLTLDKVIPRLLGPLQSDGRSIKPCLVHGDLWDENTATDMATGEPFVFDAGSFYAHNEYEIGNWRAARHRLSSKAYVKSYLNSENFPASEPVEEWNDRNLLYSLRFDLGTAILIPGCNQRQVVKDNMTVLCKKFFPDELRLLENQAETPLQVAIRGGGAEEEEEEEEEELE
ncbi:Fructosamine kinase-domain-containing protein [Lasiosphaeria hispida]|uniref:protein-ribulosamine 3-kinase n=1 Tax=Lasiosphaeria hispida TaxID=260671 RepID=A0AAJ0MB96_9PEZI|nr:Fructosamine kinase-domain-containing protein [Lasiosphaeria hispida]